MFNFSRSRGGGRDSGQNSHSRHSNIGDGRQGGGSSAGGGMQQQKMMEGRVSGLPGAMSLMSHSQHSSNPNASSNLSMNTQRTVASFTGSAFTESELLTDLPKKKFTGRCRLFVGNLPNEVKEAELKELFTPHGDIAECYLSGKGFAFLRLVLRFHSFKQNSLF
ncbi:hypothetical protein WR25_19826 [Diploscapter pachys]|uniref:RRM domain-containing protein n=1 Tax=Diploscapter pachys TaxID=2018661 RepID=A0A2A2LAT3_9BILA|nr:hypothetical protein WR25_19826 [Diploscapter pachys]